MSATMNFCGKNRYFSYNDLLFRVCFLSFILFFLYLSHCYCRVFNRMVSVIHKHSHNNNIYTIHHTVYRCATVCRYKLLKHFFFVYFFVLFCFPTTAANSICAVTCVFFFSAREIKLYCLQ